MPRPMRQCPAIAHSMSVTQRYRRTRKSLAKLSRPTVISTSYVVGLAESREAKRSVRIGADKQLRNSQFQYEMGLSSGSEKRR